MKRHYCTDLQASVLVVGITLADERPSETIGWQCGSSCRPSVSR